MAEEKSLITVIVPIYKAERYIRKCVDSILQQGYRRLEVILVDDGSPDGCPQICDAYAKADDRVTVIHKANGGVSKARNSALEVMHGEYVLFTDADDFLTEGAVQALLDAYSQEDIDLACGSYNIISEYQNEVYKLENRIIDKEQTARELFELYHCINTPWAGLYKSAIISQNHLRFDSGIKIGEDTAFNLKFLKCARKISLTSATVYNYNTTAPGSAFNTTYPDYDYYMDNIMQRIREYIMASAIADTECGNAVIRRYAELICDIDLTNYLIRTFNKKKVLPQINSILEKFEKEYFLDKEKFLAKQMGNAAKNQKCNAEAYISFWNKKNRLNFIKKDIKMKLKRCGIIR